MPAPQSVDVLGLVDHELRDDVARCVAAAGYRLLMGHPEDCRREWLHAAAVIVDADALGRVAAERLPAHAGLVVVCVGEPTTTLWREAVDFGATDVVTLPGDDGHLVRILTGLRAPARAPGRSVALVSAHGAAGASTLAAAVALAAGDNGSAAMLLDADDLSPGLDLLLGMEDHPGTRWHDMALETGAVSAAVLRSALPAIGSVSVLTGSRTQRRAVGPEALAAVIDAGRVGGELVVVDLPRADTPSVRAAIASVDLVVVVAAPSVAGCAAARVVVDRLLSARIAEGRGDVELVLRGPAPGGLRPNEVTEAIGLPLLVAYRPDPRLSRRVETGRLSVSPRSPLGRAAREVYLRALDAG